MLHKLMPESQPVHPSKRIYKMPSIKDNFGLTKSEFDRCIQNLKSGDDSFITENLATQLPESMRYLMNKLNISKEKAYDTCLNTFLIFRQKLINDQISYGNLRYLFTRMCINHFIDASKSQDRINNAIQIFLETNKHNTEDKEAFFIKLENTTKQLPLETQELIKELYYSGKSMQAIAQEKNLSYGALRKKKERILLKIRTLFFDSPK